jgi:hypothetical protein
VYGTPTTVCSDSPVSTVATSIDDEIAPASPATVATPSNNIMIGTKKYTTGQLRVMADTVDKARRTGELPASKASLEDTHVIVQDYKFLTLLRAARGNPSADNPPSEKYHALRVDIARRIKDRDDDMDDDAARAIAADRVTKFKRVVSQEDRLLHLVNLFSRTRGTINPSQVDMAAIMDEIMDIIETSMSDAAGPLRLNANRMSNTANNMDVTANNLGTSVNSLNSSMNVLSGSVNVVGAQINGLSANVQNLGSLVRILELVNERSGERVDGSIQNLHNVVTGLQAGLQVILNSIPGIIAQTVREAVQTQVAHAIREIILAQAHAINGDLGHNDEHTKASGTVEKSSIKSFFKGIFKRGPSA